MTSEILSVLQTQYVDEIPVLRFVIGGVLFQEGVQGRNPLSADIEDVFSAVQLLAHRSQLEAAPFIAAWHPLVERFDQEPLEERRVLSALESAYRADIHPERRTYRRPEFPQQLLKFVNQLRPSHQGTAYLQLLNRMTAALRELLTIRDEAIVSYLSPIAKLSQRQGGLLVGSLNYDLAVETMARQQECEIHTGLDNWVSTGKLSFPDTGIRLLKLHGSIDWVIAHDQWTSLGLLSEGIVRPSKTSDPRDLQPAVLFGSGNKLRPDGPFLDLLLHFRDELEKCNLLTVVGYSFRDAHINYYLARWLNSDTNHRLRIINKDLSVESSHWPPSFSPFLNKLLLYYDDRIEPVEMTAREGLSSILHMVDPD